MVDKATKKRIIAELEKSGNVYFACAKCGIVRATYYRWRESDKKFKKESDHAIRHGRENICDMAEHALLGKIKERDMNAIKYTLGHNSPYYKSNRDTKVFIQHSRVQDIRVDKNLTLEDLIDEAEKKS